MLKDWSLANPPPEGHPDVGHWVYTLWHESLQEKERLQLPQRWYENHRLFRGDHWNKRNTKGANDSAKTTVNFMFANIERTVANLTSREPVAELHTSDGSQDDADKVFSQKVKNWWSETEQGSILEKSALQMEVYGPTIEKYVPDLEKNALTVICTDPYEWFPAPGNYASIQDMPYICWVYAYPVPDVEAKFGVDGVEVDDTYYLFGKDREKNIPSARNSKTGAINVGGNWVMSGAPLTNTTVGNQTRALVIECWFRDPTKEKVKKVTGHDPVTGEEIIDEVDDYKYPGKIRKVTVTNRGELVLDDSPNPNVNPALPVELSRTSYGWNNYPCAKSCSYNDTTSIWGFAAAEQVGDLQLKIDELLSRIKGYVDLCCMPPLILPDSCGVSSKGAGGDIVITNSPGLIIRPRNAQDAKEIRYLQVPNLPSDFFKLLETLIGFFDRIWSIQDSDRGEKPANIQAAAAIMALQERNAVLMRHKIRATDYLVRERGRWCINFLQNFHYMEEVITVDDEPQKFRGVDFAGRQFNYIIESGATVAKTDLQREQDAKELFQLGAADAQYVLETLHVPGWKAILERLGADKVGMVMQTLQDLGLPQEYLQQIQAMIQQSQQNVPQAQNGGGGGANVPQGRMTSPSNLSQANKPAGMQGGSNPKRPMDAGLMTHK